MNCIEFLQIQFQADFKDLMEQVVVAAAVLQAVLIQVPVTLVLVTPVTPVPHPVRLQVIQIRHPVMILPVILPAIQIRHPVMILPVRLPVIQIRHHAMILPVILPAIRIRHRALMIKSQCIK